jgi:hypothetical protein
MMNEPKLRQINECEFYPKELATEITDFNAAVEQIETLRAALTVEATELRTNALTGKIEKPDKLAADASKLTARRIALDVQEIGLIARKEGFQSAVLAARKTERERLLGLEQNRRTEIADGLKAVGVDGARSNEILNGDTKVRAFAAARSEVSSYLHVIVEADQQRLAVLQGRMAAALPEIAN